MRRLLLPLVVSVLVGCGGSDTGPLFTPESAGASRTLGQAEAQAALEAALLKLSSAGTGHYVRRVEYGPGGKAGLLVEQGDYDGSRQRWKSTLNAQEGQGSGGGPIVLVGTTDAAYVTSPDWPADIRGRWYKYAVRDLQAAVGAAGQLAEIDLAAGLPTPIYVLDEATAKSATVSGTGTSILAELPTARALELANLKGGLAKLDVDIASVTGTTVVTMELGADQSMQRLVLSPGALVGAAPQLPTSLRPIVGLIATYVTFSALGKPVVIHVPVGREIVPAAEMHP